MIKAILYTLPFLLSGFLLSLKIAFFGSTLGIILGLGLALCLNSNSLLLRFPAKLYVTIIRGTPMLIQIAAMFYMLRFSGCNISGAVSATLSIGLNSGAYLSQILLAGISSIGKGQIEAGKSLCFSRLQIMRYIILPQALRAVLPALGNEFITLIKDSSLASTIGVYELTKQSEIIISQTFDAPPVYLGVALIYLAATTTLTGILHAIEKKYSYVRN